MVNLYEFYKKHSGSNSYYRQLAQEILKDKDDYTLGNAQEIISAFRNMCKPPEKNYQNNNSRFLLLCFWLFQNGYKIQEFPNLLAKPTSLYDFAYKDIREYLRKNQSGRADSSIPWAKRRELCESMKITTTDSFQDIPNALDETIRRISNRDSSFYQLEIDERLATLNELLENLLKQNGSYLSLDYDAIFFGYCSEQQIKDYRKITHCFRHGEEKSLAERQSIPEPKKRFLSEYGIFIALHIYHFTRKH